MCSQLHSTPLPCPQNFYKVARATKNWPSFALSCTQITKKVPGHQKVCTPLLCNDLKCSITCPLKDTLLSNSEKCALTCTETCSLSLC